MSSRKLDMLKIILLLIAFTLGLYLLGTIDKILLKIILLLIAFTLGLYLLGTIDKIL
jgi:hypothetical protein